MHKETSLQSKPLDQMIPRKLHVAIPERRMNSLAMPLAAGTSYWRSSMGGGQDL